MKLGDLCRVRVVTADNWTNTEILFESLNEISYEWEITTTINSNLPNHNVGGVFRYIESTGILYSWGGGQSLSNSWKFNTNNYTIEPGPFLRWGTIYYYSESGINLRRYGPSNRYIQNVGNREIIYSSGHRVGQIDNVTGNLDIYDLVRDRETNRYIMRESSSIAQVTLPNSLIRESRTVINLPFGSIDNTFSIRLLNNLLLTESFNDSEQRGIAYSGNSGVDWSHTVLGELVYYNPLFGLDSNILQNAVIGGGKCWLVSNLDLYSSTDFLHWERMRFSTRRSGCIEYIDDVTFLAEKPSARPAEQTLRYMAGAHLLRSLNWVKQSQYLLGLLTQMTPPVEVSSTGYARHTLPVSNEHWTTSFASVQRYPFQPFDAAIVGWAIFTSGGNLLHTQPFPSTITCTSGTPGLVLLPGDFTFTID